MCPNSISDNFSDWKKKPLDKWEDVAALSYKGPAVYSRYIISNCTNVLIL